MSPLSFSLLKELKQAISLGYIHDFKMNPDGLLHCPAYPDRTYEIHQISINVITCTESNSSLYLIKTNDGLLGNMIEYHEY